MRAVMKLFDIAILHRRKLDKLEKKNCKESLLFGLCEDGK